MTSFFQLLRKSPTMMVGFVIVLMVVIVGVFAPWLAPKDPNTTSLFDRVKPPSKEYPFGTDNLGRDLLSRIIWGTRVSLQVGVISVSIGMALGVLLGVLAGYYGGRLDLVISAAMDLLLSFPAILLAIAMVAALGPGIVQVMVAVGISLVPNFARITAAPCWPFAALSLSWLREDSAPAISGSSRDTCCPISLRPSWFWPRSTRRSPSLWRPA